MKDFEKKRTKDDPGEESDGEKSKKPAKKTKAKTPAKPRIKPSFYYVSSSEDEADILKDRFWKDLEDGKVDIFRTADLYSTVKAIGRTARPKSLAESDLRKSGLRSATVQQRDQTEAKRKGKKGKKTSGKGGKKGDSKRVLPGEEDESDHNITRVKNNKRKKKDVIEDEEEMEAEEEAEEEKEGETEDESDAEAWCKKGIKKAQKGKGKTPKKGQKDDEMEDDGDDDDPKRRPKFKRKEDNDDEEEEETEEEDEEGTYQKTKKKRKLKIKTNRKKTEEDESENDSEGKVSAPKAGKKATPKRKKKKIEEEDEKEEGNEEITKDDEVEVMKSDKKAKKEMELKITVDPELVRQHMEEAIDMVISESAAIWREKYGGTETLDSEEDEKPPTELGGSTSEDNVAASSSNLAKKNKKRKHEEDLSENSPSHSSRSKTGLTAKKITSNRIDYISDEDTEPLKQSVGSEEHAGKDDGDLKGAGVDSDKAVGEEAPSERDSEELKEPALEEMNVNDQEVGERDTACSDVPSELLGPEDLKMEMKNSEETTNSKSSEKDDLFEDHLNLDHLVFNLETVDSIISEEVIDAYSEWNIKALTNEDLYKAVKFNDFDLVQAMMREASHFDLEQVDSTGYTLTMIATQNYSMEIVEMLVLNGADVNAKAKDGNTALTLACDKGLHCAVSLLLCLGANVGCQLPTGETPLMLAVRKNYYHIVRILLDYGVNIGAVAGGDRHALSLARQLNHQPIVELLTSHKMHLTSELFQQVSMALEGSAKISASVFPIQCFRLCDGSRFVVDFRHELQPTQTNRGMLLFIGHGCGSASEVQVRLFGSCAVSKAVLNNVPLQPLNEDNFIMTFCPLRDGHNQLDISTVPLSQKTYKVHLIVAAFVVTLL